MTTKELVWVIAFEFSQLKNLYDPILDGRILNNLKII